MPASTTRQALSRDEINAQFEAFLTATRTIAEKEAKDQAEIAKLKASGVRIVDTMNRMAELGYELAPGPMGLPTVRDITMVALSTTLSNEEKEARIHSLQVARKAFCNPLWIAPKATYDYYGMEQISSIENKEDPRNTNAMLAGGLVSTIA